jgi:hypothetical protein
MPLVVSPKESETKIVNDFLNALNKVGVKYEHYPEKFQIKIKGYIVDVSPFIIPELKFEQEKRKRIHMSRSSKAIIIKIFDKKNPVVIEIKFPIKWYIRYQKPYLEINY